ncbi:MAG: PQQ-binding-like beta-propeller repeat protein [bacterium]|nr:hypothetical protein [Planctomycetota bacterium]HIL51215.1 hypothetical protein [Planctomycetota bacterium]
MSTFHDNSNAALRRWACLALFCAPVLAAASAQEPDLAEEIRGFSIPTTRAARVLLERAQEHIAAERWNEAIADLQGLLEVHGADVVQAEDLAASGARVHHGVSKVATAHLMALPPAARDIYRRRFDGKARGAFDLARSRGDRRALCAVALRWPLCDVAAWVWWTVGDLELELGNLVLAREAWTRALGARLARTTSTLGDRSPTAPRQHSIEEWNAARSELSDLGAALTPSEEARVELAISTLHDENPLAAAALTRAAARGSLRLPGPGEAPPGTPGEKTSAWPKPFRVPTPHPFDRSGYSNLFPVRVGDSVLVSNSLQLFSINAFSGALRWKSERPDGWDRLSDNQAREFFEGVDIRDAMIAPAASERVAVAALQVPITDISNETFRNIAITTIIPDRRLFAFDIESGEMLWNHAPPPFWDGESGGFTERMSVAGPPVVSASRIFVPMHRMYGRIEFYVACCDLESGELLWSTQLVSGQRSLNMFARAETEFTAPPLRVEGDRIIALTQLGALAALDLFSGAILWETLYDQIPPPQRSNFSAQRINNKWRNAPPVVAAGVVIAAPFDSRDLIGCDLQSGEPLWTVQHTWIQHLAGGRAAKIDVLVGADERVVYLGSWPVLALKADAGLAHQAPRSLAWRFPAGDVTTDESTAARPILLADRMVIPWRSERVEIELLGGRRRSKSVPWQTGGGGNLLAEGGTLYTLGPRLLDGYFQWDLLIERARSDWANAPDDEEATLLLARLCAGRGRSERDAGHTTEARDWLRDAGDLLEDSLALADPSAEIEAEMHAILRARAQVFADLADGPSALRELRRARQFAPLAADLRDTLIEEFELLRGVDVAAQSEVLEALELHAPDHAVATRLSAQEARSCGWRYVPLKAGSTKDFSSVDVPVPLWTTFERRELAARAHDPRGELDQLQRMLAKWPAFPLRQGSLGNHARGTISDLLERHGRGIYGDFEKAARELLQRAQLAQDEQLLIDVGAQFPHSLAAREAADALLVWASERGDLAAVARFALAELPANWGPGTATDRQLGLLAHLGSALARAGNLDAALALALKLADTAPGLVSPAVGDGGLTLGELARRRAAIPMATQPSPAEFPGRLFPELQVQGEHTFLGRIPVKDGSDEYTGEVLLFARSLGRRGQSISLVAYSAQSLTALKPQRLWEVSVPLREAPASWQNAICITNGLVIISSGEEIYALERNSGEWRWTWTAIDGDIESIQLADGLVYATTHRRPGTLDGLSGICAVTGAELWSTNFERLTLDSRPICGSGRVVFLPRHSRRSGRVLDAFSGREQLRYTLPESMLHASISTAWIEDGKLIVPWFLSGRNPARNRICALDLSSAKVVWNLSFDELHGGRRELRSILQYDGTTYLLLQAQSQSEDEGVTGLLVKLHSGLGATAQVGGLRLGREQRILGIGSERRVELEHPYLYVRSFVEGGGPLRIQQVLLNQGGLGWTQHIGITREELYNSELRLPATGGQALALALSVKQGARRFGLPEGYLFLFNTATGELLSRQRLDAKLGSSDTISLHGLGSALLIAGKDTMEVMR